MNINKNQKALQKHIKRICLFIIEFDDIIDAFKYEKKLKHSKRIFKIKLILQMNPKWENLISY